MRPLAQFLAQRPGADPLWCTGTGWQSVGAVQGQAAALAKRLPGGRIALAMADDASLAPVLLAADGRCAAVLLVPSAWDQALLRRYWTLAQIDCLVTNRAELTAPQVVRVAAEVEIAADSPALAGEADTQWIIPTSGTTGEPKLVAHSFHSLARTVKTDAAKGRGLVWGLVYELARFAGLQVFLQAVLGGSRLVFVDRGSDLVTMIARLAAAGGNALSATPTFWRKVLMTPGADGLALRLITLGGEIADQAILTLLAERYPQAKILHIYASTEVGVGFSVTDGRAGFPAAYFRQAPGEMALRVDADGMLWLRPARAEQHWLGRSEGLVAADGWINSGDRVNVAGDRCYFLGRANGAINVGGNKVFPEEVENCIRGVAGVLMVGVRARANPMTGSLVEALVKADPAADRAALKRTITSTCRAALAAYKVPALVTWVDELAVNPAGKLVRT